MHSTPTCFFAYPSRPASLSETIETAINEINATNALIIRGWKSLDIVGRVIIEEICRAVDSHDIFACDLTYLNFNVLFELGYAIARQKRIWIILDPTVKEATANYRRLEMITTVGYAAYNNSHEIASKMLAFRPFEKNNAPVFQVSVEAVIESVGKPSLFYLKSDIETDAARRLTSKISAGNIPVLTDDPYDSGFQPLSGYAQKVNGALGVVAHLLGDDRNDDSLQNARYSFICGLAYGFGKPILMLAHSPFDLPPIDYHDMLLIHSTATQCIQAFEFWLPKIADRFAEQQRIYQNYRANKKRLEKLQDIDVGSYIAEEERYELENYFVETAEYADALRGPSYRIYIGRKGSGKSANLERLADQLGSDRRNHVCVARPADYQLEGILDLFRLSMSRSDRGYLVQSLWKFLIYTELARSVLIEVENRPIHYVMSKSEQEFVTFAKNYSSLIEPDFADRMRVAIENVCSINFADSKPSGKSRISEMLHEAFLGELRKYLGIILEDRRNIFILIDNLDKVWVRSDAISDMSEMLYGLLNACPAISEELRKTGSEWRSINASLLIFLRSDIFDHVLSIAPERDKITVAKLVWEDRDLLRRIIEERFLAGAGNLATPEEVWSRFFAPAVRGMPTQEYLLSRIIPRPRDLIYWCKYALNNAINRGHTIIEEGDILAAEKLYSQYVLESLIAENAVRVDNFGDLMYEFAGAREIITLGDIKRIAHKYNMLQIQIKDFVEVLCNSAFLGLEVSEGRFEFIHEEGKGRVFRSMAENHAQSTSVKRYAVNVPFHSYLEIRPVLSS